MARTRKDPQGWESAGVAVAEMAPSENVMPAVLADVVAEVAQGSDPTPLDLEHFTLGPTGLIVKGRPNFEEWSNIGSMLRLFEQGVQWLIGDWVCFGEGEWGDKTAQVIDAEQWSAETVRVYRWVASKVPLTRRVPGLDFSHHMAVAEMTPSQQTVWLQRAIKGSDGKRWSVAELKREIKRKELGGSAASAIEYLVEVKCASEVDQAECGRQLENLGRAYTLKTKGGPTVN